MSRFGKAQEFVQKVFYGQSVDMVLTASPSGRWTVSIPKVTSPAFAPRLGPVRGGGTTWLAKVGRTPVWVGRRGGVEGTNFTRLAHTGNSSGFNRLGSTSRAFGAAATVVGVVSCAAGQWQNDKGRTDLTSGERCARVGIRTTAETGLGMLGGMGGRWAGAAYGAAVGSAVAPGPGTAIGALVGGIGGGIAGGIAAGKLGSSITDDYIDELGGKVGGFLDRTGETFADLHGAIRVRDTMDRVHESLRRFMPR